jgi:hypothetical protein
MTHNSERTAEDTTKMSDWRNFEGAVSFDNCVTGFAAQKPHHTITAAFAEVETLQQGVAGRQEHNQALQYLVRVQIKLLL